MGKAALLTLILIIYFFLVPATHAKASHLFIDHLNDIIYEDCRGKNINIKYIHDGNQTVPSLLWPYNKSRLRTILRLYGDHEPYLKHYGKNNTIGVTGTLDGYGILTCQENRLDIDEYDYFWNGVRVDVPKEEIKITSGSNSPIIENYADRSLITIGNNSPINQQENNIWFQLFWSKGTIGGLIVALLAIVFKNGWQFLPDKHKKFIEEYHIKAEFRRIKANLEVGGTPKPIGNLLYGPDHVKKYQLFGENRTEVLSWYDGFNKYDIKFEELRKHGDFLGIERLQLSKANEMGGIFSSHWLKKIPEDYSDLSTIKFVRYLLGRDAKEEPTKKGWWQFWK